MTSSVTTRRTTRAIPTSTSCRPPAASRSASRARKATRPSPTWSPDGRFIAFVAKRGDDKQSQLYVIAANGGEATRVSDVPTGVASPKWFPDSKHIAFITEVWPDITDWAKTKEKLTAREESKMSAMTWDRPPVTHWDHFIEDRIPHLYSIAIDGGDAASRSR